MIISELFDDHRTLTPLPYDNEGYLFQAENELIYTESIIEGEFNIEKLTKYVEIAEELNREYFCRINIYIILSEGVDVTVNSMNITSEADFCIKVHQSQDASISFLKNVKHKIEEGITLTDQEIEIIQMLPIYCKEEDRHKIRLECLKILQKVNLNAK